MRPLAIAVLVKQVPKVESLELTREGRLRREGVELEMNAYCRRAVSKGVELARASGGRCVVLTLAPPAGEDVLREALAWGADDAVLVSDPAFAGSDTLATAQALAAALRREGPFDLVLAGRNSIDADTGQVPPEVAELLGMPFVAAARELSVEDGALVARSELDDGWRRVRVELPAVVSTAERLCEPCKVDPDLRRAVEAGRIRRLRADQLGDGPFGEEASPTRVGAVRTFEVHRRRVRLDGPPSVQAAAFVEHLVSSGVLGPGALRSPVSGDGRGAAVDAVGVPGGQRGDGRDGFDPMGSRRPEGPPARGTSGSAGGPVVAVLGEPRRGGVVAELLGAARRLADDLGGEVVALLPVGEGTAEAVLGDEPRGRGTAQGAAWGADRVVFLEGSELEDDVAPVVAAFAQAVTPWALLAPGTLYGREVAARVAARLRAGLTGDAVGLEVEHGRLVCLKPAFGGRLVAAITATSPVQLATVRPGVLGVEPPERARAATPTIEHTPVPRRGRLEVLDAGRDDDVLRLLRARRILAVGAGVDPSEYGLLEDLRELLGAELAASRKVTDRGWLPRARQVGITGHSVAPELYLAIGIQGKFNHVVGTRGAKVVVALNRDPEAPIFEWADLGLVGDWHELVPALTAALEAHVASLAVPASAGRTGR